MENIIIVPLLSTCAGATPDRFRRPVNYPEPPLPPTFSAVQSFNHNEFKTPGKPAKDRVLSSRNNNSSRIPCRTDERKKNLTRSIYRILAPLIMQRKPLVADVFQTPKRVDYFEWSQRKLATKSKASKMTPPAGHRKRMVGKTTWGKLFSINEFYWLSPLARIGELVAGGNLHPVENRTREKKNLAQNNGK